jgi:hypothetical protein
MREWVPAMGMIGVLVLLLVLMIPAWLLARDDRRERERKAAGMR